MALYIKPPKNLNRELQLYKHFKFRFMGQITTQAARFTLFDTNQNIWIPRKHFDENLNLKEGENIDYVFSFGGTPIKLAIIINNLQEEINQRKGR